MKKLFAAIFSPGVLRILGAILLALLVWIAGPLFSFAQWRPLDPGWVRLTLIALLLLLWFGKRAVLAVRAKLANARLFDSMAGKGAAAAPSGADEAVRKRFETALATLKVAQFSGESGPGQESRLSRLMQGKRYLYQLPWYLFIGPPGSGKTTALIHSGLKFPLANQVGNDPLQGVGGTRNCQWWFTDRAVLIDTAGRYTTQDSDQTTDSAEWTGFLQLLAKHRPRQPINGILLTLSCSDLLTLSEQQLQAHANAVRARIDELQKTLKLQFPVYLLVTKTDLLPGFMEFFGDFDREQREQIWGTTVPPAGISAKAVTAYSAAQCAADLKQLVQRLSAQVNERLNRERLLAQRQMIFGFPAQFASIAHGLTSYVDQVFGSSQFVGTSLLRGVFFTSGTQEGSPIDRLLGSMTRSIGLERKALAATRPSGKSFFITRLFNQVIFAESGLAGTNQAWEQRLRRLKWLATAASVIALFCAAIAWTLSYLNNNAYLGDVQASTQALGAQLTNQRIDNTATLASVLPVLAQMKALALTETVNVESPPLGHTWGLFQGEKMDAAARTSYRRALATALAPVLSRRIEDVLRRGSQNPELLYETLKAYLMLHQREHLDATALKGWIAFDARTELGRALSDEQRNELQQHLDVLLARDSIAPEAQIDGVLVDRVRRALLGTPFPVRVASRIKRQGFGSEFADFRIPQAAGNNAHMVLTRLSGTAMTQGVPGAYTFDGYHKGFQKQLDPLLKQLGEEETWVLGVANSDNARRLGDSRQRESLANEVRLVYLQEYIAIWEKFLADIALIKTNSLQQSVQLARLLSAPDSPLPRLLKAVAREVSLAEQTGPVAAAAKGALDKATDAVKETQDNLSRMLGGNAPAVVLPGPAAARKIESMVDDRFEALRRYVKSPAAGQPAPVDATMTLINDLYNLLIATETAVSSNNPPPASDLPNRVKGEAARLPEPVRSMMNTLAVNGTNQALGATRENIGQMLQSNIGEFCRKAIEGRYPVAAGSTRDIVPEDFARMFAADGLMDEFFKKNLAQFVDTSSKPWKFRRQGDSTMGEGSVALVQFQRADEIRKVFFTGGSRTPSVRVDLKPLEMDPAILQFSLDADGQVLKYSHGPIVPTSIAWPGPKATGQIRIQISPASASGNSGMVFEGPWAIYRMFDRAQIERSGQPEKFRASFNFEGRRALFDVTASSVQNPFRLPELQSFTCPSRL
jgi:type VI secretion system protein ImpL